MDVKYTYDKLFLKDVISGKKICVPQYQRNVVWNNTKRKEFVETLREGNPFGSILVHQNGQELVLVDGLQRISTIKDYCKNPYKYFSYKDLNEEFILEAIKNSYEVKGFFYDPNSLAVIKACETIRKSMFIKMSENMAEDDIKLDIIKDNDLIADKTTFKAFSRAISDFKDSSDISNLIIPTIIYTGESEKLPTIFYNLNTGGVNLSKYETFSSLWPSRKFLIKDEELIDKIYNKYKQLMEKSDLVVDVTREDIVENGISLFEYCYSISEILRDEKKKFVIILGSNKKSTDPMGFEILSLICGFNVNKAENLPEKLISAPEEFLVKIKDVIIETFEVLTGALEKAVIGINGGYNTLDSMYMIYHMAMAYIINNYSIDFNNFKIEKIINRDWNTKFKKYLYLYYFRDYITDYWKKNRQVTDLTREINNRDSLNRYINNISINEWEQVMAEFRENQLNEETSQISLKSKLFIDYLTKMKLKEVPSYIVYTQTKFDDKKIKIDFEHICPQKRIEEQIKAKSKGEIKNFPISSVGNLCYLASRDNRAKKEKTLYEYVENRPSYVVAKDYLSFIDYPDKDELRFINYESSEFEREYKSFITNRLDFLIREFIEYLHHLS